MQTKEQKYKNEIEEKFSDVSEAGMKRISTEKLEEQKTKSLSLTMFSQGLIKKPIEKMVESFNKIDNNGNLIKRKELILEFLGEDFFSKKKLQESLSLNIYLILVSGLYLENKKQKFNFRQNISDLVIDKVFNIKKKTVDADKFDRARNLSAWLIQSAVNLSDFIVEVTGQESATKKTNSYELDSKVRMQLLSQLDSIIDFSFYPLPMTEKPLNWQFDDNNKLSGGYINNTSSLIRKSKLSKNISPLFLKNTQALQAINYIQSVKYSINLTVLDQLEQDIKSRGEILEAETKRVKKLQIGNGELSELFREITPSEKEEKELKGLWSTYYAINNILIKETDKYNADLTVLTIAKKYKNIPFYQPHSFDYRGRIYPINVLLNNQGSDASKGLIQFYDGEYLTDEGLKNAYAYLYSLLGNDKKNIMQRAHEGNYVFSTKDKNKYLSIAEENKSKYQFLQVWQSLEDHFQGKKSHLGIELDASSSAIQIVSLLLKDKIGASDSNMGNDTVTTVTENGDINIQKQRRDIYVIVANKAIDLINEDFNNNKFGGEKLVSEADIKFLIEKLKDVKIKRNLSKKIVMTAYYGAGDWKHSEDIRIILNEFNNKDIDTFKMSRYLTEQITKSLPGNFKRYKKWMSNIFGELSDKNNDSIYFTVEDGFTVQVKKYLSEKKKIEFVAIDGKKSKSGKKVATNITFHDLTDKVNKAKIKGSISPNWVHAVDSLIIRKLVIKLKEKGINNFRGIHDAYNVSPNNINLLNDEVRETMVEIFENDPLQRLYDDIEMQLGNEIDKMDIYKGDEEYNLYDLLDNEFAIS